MASSGKLEVEVEMKSSPDKLWTSIKESEKVFPKASPEYKSIEILEGDGQAVGTVRLIKYAEGVPLVTISKEKIEAIDEGKKTMSYSVIDGELIDYYKSFKAQVVVGPSPKGDGSLVNWSCEFEKTKEEFPDPHLIKDFAVKTFHELDAFLLKA